MSNESHPENPQTGADAPPSELYATTAFAVTVSLKTPGPYAAVTNGKAPSGPSWMVVQVSSPAASGLKLVSARELPGSKGKVRSLPPSNGGRTMLCHVELDGDLEYALCVMLKDGQDCLAYGEGPLTANPECYGCDALEIRGPIPRPRIIIQ